MSLASREFMPSKAVIVFLFAALCFLFSIHIVSAGELVFKGSGKTAVGTWKADFKILSADMRPGAVVDVEALLSLDQVLLDQLDVKQLLMLVTSERSFDPEGRMHFPSHERMSTLLTPTGLAIEGGAQDAISKVAGSPYRNPVDELVKLPLNELKRQNGFVTGRFRFKVVLPADTPPGLYRLRFDFGIATKTKTTSLNLDNGFARRTRDVKYTSMAYSPLLRCDGKDTGGRHVRSDKIQPRIYWTLLDRYNSNGYRGVVADEDSSSYGLSHRNIIQDEVILPLYAADGRTMSYNLEPSFFPDSVDWERSIPWDYASGELSATIVHPSGHSTVLGKTAFVAAAGISPTTKDPRFTSWTPSGYGRYTVVLKGSMKDVWGNRYQGGGTYRFWIGRRMTMATATFQGMSYPVGTSYGRDISFMPAVPAEVTVDATIYPDSNRSRAKTLHYFGRATSAGVFGAAQGMKPFVLDKPGEYHAHILATYIDMNGHLWVCSLRHAGVVYPEDSFMDAHGKRLRIGKQFVDRGETGKEGFVQPDDGFRNLDHINFPYNQGDALLIASEGSGANKIEPVLTYEFRGGPRQQDQKFQGIGATNVVIKTSNGMSPHLYPEYITDWEYFYAAAPRPGFSSRFLVGENGVRAPYWPTSATNFGGQIGASNNGDLPGDIYRLVGGVVVRRAKQPAHYAGYMASAFILPKGTKNNRVIAAGSEELMAADGRKSRFMLVSARPGLVYEQNSSFVPFVQIDPILPAQVRYLLKYPDGREKAAEGIGDSFGSFVGPERWQLDQEGVYQYRISASWQGYNGHMPGLPKDGGYLFVRNGTVNQQLGMRLLLPDQKTFKPESPAEITGYSTASEVFYTVLTPGAVIDQGKIATKNGMFSYLLDPSAINRRIPIYDTENRNNGRKEIGRVIHLTFFALEKPVNAAPFYSFKRVIVRGNTIHHTN